MASFRDGGIMGNPMGRGQLRSLVQELEGARVPEIRRAVRAMLRQIEDGAVLLDEVRDLVVADEPEARHVACSLLARCFVQTAPDALELLEQLSADRDWMVRDAASQAAGTLLRTSFDPVLDKLRAFAAHDNPYVRRCVPIAAAKAGRSRRPEYAVPLLKLIAPLLEDNDPIVRRSLGPLALGQGLLCSYPTETFEALVQWSTSYDAQVLWNVAMAFSGRCAGGMVKKALIILRKLALDERRYVWRAVASAMWKLGKRCSVEVRPQLAAWLEDEDRVHVARAALQHLDGN
jgi:hypothetical protein